MPFPEQVARVFNQQGVDSVQDGEGCYGLFVGNGPWVYVGRGKVRDRLLAHLNGDNPCITKQKPTHFKIGYTADHEAWEKQLIVELRPACNQKVG